MGDHLTFGIRSAKSRTRILALLAQTGPVRCAIRMHQTFWSAHLVRIAGVFGQTLASAGAVLFATNCIRSARTRLTWAAVDWWIG